MLLSDSLDVTVSLLPGLSTFLLYSSPGSPEPAASSPQAASAPWYGGTAAAQPARGGLSRDVLWRQPWALPAVFHGIDGWAAGQDSLRNPIR